MLLLRSKHSRPNHRTRPANNPELHPPSDTQGASDFICIPSCSSSRPTYCYLSSARPTEVSCFPRSPSPRSTYPSKIHPQEQPSSQDYLILPVNPRIFKVPETHPQDQPIPFAQPYRTRQVLSYPPTQLTHAAYQLLRLQEICDVEEFVNKREAYLEKK